MIELSVHSRSTFLCGAQKQPILKPQPSATYKNDERTHQSDWPKPWARSKVFARIFRLKCSPTYCCRPAGGWKESVNFVQHYPLGIICRMRNAKFEMRSNLSRRMCRRSGCHTKATTSHSSCDFWPHQSPETLSTVRRLRNFYRKSNIRLGELLLRDRHISVKRAKSSVPKLPI